MSNAVALDPLFLVDDFELNNEQEKEQKELGTIIATLKGLDQTFSKMEGLNLHDAKKKGHPKGLMAQLESALGEMQKALNSLETQMIKSQNQQATFQIDIGEVVVKNLKNEVKKISDEINKIQKEIKSEEKKEKIIKWVGISIAVVGILAGAATGQWELVIISATLLALSASGELGKMKKGLAEKYEDWFGLSKSDARLLADATIILAAVAISGGIGAGGSFAFTAEAGAEAGAEATAEGAASEGAEEGASSSRPSWFKTRRTFSMATLGFAQSLSQVNMAADIVNSFSYSSQSEKEKWLFTAEIAQAGLAAGISFGAAYYGLGGESAIFERFGESRVISFLLRNMGYILCGTAFVQGSGAFTEGWLDISLGLTKEKQADTTQKTGETRAKSNVSHSTMGMNDRAIKGSNQFLETLMKDFAFMTENTSSYGDPMQAAAEAIASVSY